eukprot:SAG11_NODE_33732_length_275_cov_1.732955_1_plen_50_part_10
MGGGAEPAGEQALAAHWSGWLRRMHEMMQRPAAVFSRSHPSITLSQRGAV